MSIDAIKLLITFQLKKFQLYIISPDRGEEEEKKVARLWLPRLKGPYCGVS